MLKPLKLLFWDPICTKKGSARATPKVHHQLSETFYFMKISYVLAVLLIFFYFVCCFLSKKSYFHLKQLLCLFFHIYPEQKVSDIQLATPKNHW